MGCRRGDELIRPIVVLTGGIGTGKSTVGRILEELGADVVEADLLGHAVLERGGSAFSAVAARWPEAVEDGRINRRVLGQVVFSDRDALRELERLTHPGIRELLLERIESSDAAILVVEVPIPAAWLDPSWPRIVVDVDDATRRARLLDRGMTSEEIESRLAAQPSRTEWRDLADHIIVNDGDRSALVGEVGKLWERLHRTVSPEG